jgi:hypothetical protein
LIHERETTGSREVGKSDLGFDPDQSFPAYGFLLSDDPARTIAWESIQPSQALETNYFNSRLTFPPSRLPVDSLIMDRYFELAALVSRQHAYSR